MCWFCYQQFDLKNKKIKTFCTWTWISVTLLAVNMLLMPTSRCLKHPFVFLHFSSSFSWCKLNVGHCYSRSSVKEQKHSASYSKADVALNDNAIWLIVPIVITAISIIYWAEWAGDEVQHYYKLKQGSFIHLTVIPLTLAAESAKPG